MATWDPTQYLRFSDHRLRPAIDLLGRVDHPGPRRVWDLGCGAGGPTALLAARWPRASITGVDSSPDMLEKARAEHPDIEWIRGDIEGWAPDEPADIVYSNAAIHWLDDHQTLVPHLFRQLAPGGLLAIQMPRNHSEPSHQRLYETAMSTRWADRVGDLVRESPVAPPHVYHSMLRPIATSVDVWETIYQQELTGDDAVANWTKGSVVRPFLDALGADGDEFFRDYAARLEEDYPTGPDGTTLFSFRRVFVVAKR